MPSVYPNLSGFVTDYKDGGLAAPPPLADTENVTLIGTAPDGPNNAPVVVTVPQGAVDFFGDRTGNRSASLIKAIVDAYDAGARNINAVRLGGEFASKALKVNTPVSLGYVEIDPNIEFEIPDPVYTPRLEDGVLTITQGDMVVFPIAGFTPDAILGGQFRIGLTFDGTVFSSLQTIPLTRVADVEIEADDDPTHLPQADFVTVDICGTPAVDDDATIASGFMRIPLGNTNLYSAGTATGDGLYGPAGTVDLGATVANFGNLGLELNYANYNVATATTLHKRWTVGNFRVASRASLSYTWETIAASGYHLSGVAVNGIADMTADTDTFTLSVDSGDSNKIPSGAMVLMARGLATNFNLTGINHGSAPDIIAAKAMASGTTLAFSCKATALQPGGSYPTLASCTLDRVQRLTIDTTSDPTFFTITPSGSPVDVTIVELVDGASDNPFRADTASHENRVLFSNSGTDNMDLGGTSANPAHYGNLLVKVTVNEGSISGTTRVLTCKRVAKSVGWSEWTTNTDPAPEFTYDATDPDSTVLMFGTWLADHTGDDDFLIEVFGTLLGDCPAGFTATDVTADVQTYVAALEVYSGPEGFAYATSGDVGGAIYAPVQYFYGLGTNGDENITDSTTGTVNVGGTMYQGTTGAKAVQTALLAADVYGAIADTFVVPYIKTGETTMTNVADATTVSIELVGTGGLATTKVRFKDITDPDIIAGVYSYAPVTGSPVGVFGRTIIVDDALVATDSIRTPYIKANSSGKAILLSRDATLGAVTVGTVTKADHEEAVFTLDTAQTLPVGEYWYYTDVAIYLRAAYPGELYGDGSWGDYCGDIVNGSAPTKGVRAVVDETVSRKVLTVYKPASKGFPDRFEVLLNPDATDVTYKDVVVGINTAIENTVVSARFVADYAHPLIYDQLQYDATQDLVDNTADTVQYLIGGDDGIGKDPSYYLMKLLGTQYDTGTLQLIENHPVDNLVLVDLYADVESRQKAFGISRKLYYNEATGVVIVNPDGTIAAADLSDAEANDTLTDFAQVLGDHCYQCALNGNERLGYVSVSPSTDFSLQGTSARVRKLTKTYGVDVARIYTGFKTTNPLDGRTEDVGRYLSVCAGPEVISNATGLPATIETIYAARVSTLPPQSAPTHKPIFGFDSLVYNYSSPQLNDLTGMKYVTLYSYGDILYVTDGITAAGDFKPGQKSDYTRLSTVRVVHAAMAGIRRVANPFLGQPNSIPMRIALNTAIDEFLRTMVSAGALSDYSFTIMSTQAMQIIGELHISLTLRAWLELRKITTVVSLALPEG